MLVYKTQSQVAFVFMQFPGTFCNFGHLQTKIMEIIIISAAALIVAILTFFSGFGLGTILTPVFMIFFPTDLAIALTGVVHFFNNIFKLFLVGKNADKSVLLRFGIPAVIEGY